MLTVQSITSCLGSNLGALRTAPGIVIAVAALAVGAQAQITNLTAVIDALQEVPPSGTPATGSACMVLDQTAHTLTFNIAYTGLSAAETSAHIHCCAAPGVAACCIMIVLPPGNPKIGAIGVTPVQEANLLSGLTYINIHNGSFPGGEIRGQVLVAPAPVNFCFGDGTGTACPCGNSSGAGLQEGCANSLGTGGRLRGSGFSSLACDSLLLSGSGMPNSTAIYFQALAQENGGLGTALFDGLLCVNSSIVRFGTTVNSGGASQYPNVGQPSISVRCSVTAPGTRDYEVFYRNAAAAFCPPATANYTNGVECTWVP